MFGPASIVQSNALAFALAASVRADILTDGPQSIGTSLRIWQNQAQVYHNDSFLIGNGRLGASILGTYNQDPIQVNEDSLWSGDFTDRINPDARANIPVMQQQILAGRNDEAQVLGSFAYASTPIASRYYAYLATMNLIMNHTHPNLTAYERYLDVENSTVGIYYTLLNNASYFREYLASQPENVIAVRITSNVSGSVDFSVNIRRGENENRWERYNHHVSNDTVVMGEELGGYQGVGGIQYAAGVKVVASGGKVKPWAEVSKWKLRTKRSSSTAHGRPIEKRIHSQLWSMTLSAWPARAGRTSNQDI